MRKTVQTIVRTTWDFAFPRPEQLAIDYDQPPAPRQVEEAPRKREYRCGNCNGIGHQAKTCPGGGKIYTCKHPGCGRPVLERYLHMHALDEHRVALPAKRLGEMFEVTTRPPGDGD